MAGNGSVEIFAQALRRLPCGVVVASTSASGEVLLVNAEFTAITGYVLEDIPTVGDWLARAYPDPDYRAKVVGNWERDVSEPGRDVVYRIRCADGGDKELLLRAGLLGSDRMVVALLDLTVLHRTQQELRESQERFDQIASKVGQVFWIYGIHPDRIDYASPAFEEIWGRPVQVLYDDPHNWAAAMLEEDRPAVMEAWGEALAGRMERVSLEYRIRRPDGTVRWIEDGGTAIRDADGQVVRMVGIAKDVTERAEAELARRELQQQVQFAQKMESLGVLAGGVAHDFNNLLMGILGHADLAAQQLDAESPVQESLDAILASARQAAELARQMLAYAGKGQFTMARIDLGELVDGFSGLLTAAAPGRGTLEFELDADVPTIEGDPTQIRQVVLNLVTNAADALGEGGGTIRVSVGSGPGATSWVQVQDDGRGMDEQTRRRIFDPFFTTKVTGHGLGLAVVHGLVQAHRGSIEVDSEQDRGTTIRVSFPTVEGAARGSTPDEERRLPEATSGQRKGRLLIADDEPTVRTVVARMLRFGGYEVVTADDGREAVDRYREHDGAFDLVILDLTMPRLDGLGALRELRAIDPAVRVLLSSGYTEVDTSLELPGGPPLGFLQKPYTTRILLETLRGLVG
jgi:two-component system, cell cycle sensor histidine kinase and response regulator CckA